jgi:hypothetical protein
MEWAVIIDLLLPEIQLLNGSTFTATATTLRLVQEDFIPLHHLVEHLELILSVYIYLAVVISAVLLSVIEQGGYRVLQLVLWLVMLVV